jgi:hypothetical protein
MRRRQWQVWDAGEIKHIATLDRRYTGVGMLEISNDHVELSKLRDDLVICGVG